MGSHYSSATTNMKVILALCLLGAANAGVLPLTYTQGVIPANQGVFTTGLVSQNPSVVTYTAGATIPQTAGVVRYSNVVPSNVGLTNIVSNNVPVIPYTGAGVVPYTGAGVVPYTGAGVVPYTGAGVVPYTGAVALPATTYIQTPTQGQYVAKTLGSEHVAPLPQGSANIASHHINLEKAPGTA